MGSSLTVLFSINYLIDCIILSGFLMDLDSPKLDISWMEQIGLLLYSLGNSSAQFTYLIFIFLKAHFEAEAFGLSLSIQYRCLSISYFSSSCLCTTFSYILLGFWLSPRYFSAIFFQQLRHSARWQLMLLSFSSLSFMSFLALTFFFRSSRSSCSFFMYMVRYWSALVLHYNIFYSISSAFLQYWSLNLSVYVFCMFPNTSFAFCLASCFYLRIFWTLSSFSFLFYNIYYFSLCFSFSITILLYLFYLSLFSTGIDDNPMPNGRKA